MGKWVAGPLVDHKVNTRAPDGADNKRATIENIPLTDSIFRGTITFTPDDIEEAWYNPSTLQITNGVSYLSFWDISVSDSLSQYSRMPNSINCPLGLGGCVK